MVLVLVRLLADFSTMGFFSAMTIKMFFLSFMGGRFSSIFANAFVFISPSYLSRQKIALFFALMLRAENSAILRCFLGIMVSQFLLDRGPKVTPPFRKRLALFAP